MYENTQVFKTMLQVQASLNDVMGGMQWRNATLANDQGFSFREAIFVESGEAIAHTDYKWWTKATTDISQFKMELIDIAHFLLSFSHVVEASAEPFYWRDEPNREYTMMDAICEAWHNATTRHYPDGDFIVPSPKTSVRHLMTLNTNLYGRHTATQVTYTTFDLCGAWEALFCALRATFPYYGVENLLTDYLSKSLLNRFRTTSGSKQYGVATTEIDWFENQNKYLKIWNGREDVEHLSDMVANLLKTGSLDGDLLLAELSSVYEEVTNVIRIRLSGKQAYALPAE